MCIYIYMMCVYIYVYICIYIYIYIYTYINGPEWQTTSFNVQHVNPCLDRQVDNRCGHPCEKRVKEID